MGRTRTIVLHDFASGKELRRWRAHVDRINSLAWSPDGKTLASCGSKHSAIQRWDPTTGKELKTAEEGHVSPIYHLMFRQDGRRLDTISQDGRWLEWDLATRKTRLLASTWPAASGIQIFAVSSDRTILASTDGGQDQPDIELYEAITNKKLRTLSGHTDAVGDVAFDAEGRRLFSLGQDRTVRAPGTSARERSSGKRR